MPVRIGFPRRFIERNNNVSRKSRRFTTESLVRRLTSFFPSRTREEKLSSRAAASDTEKTAEKDRNRHAQRERVYSLIPEYYPTSSYWGSDRNHRH